MKGLLFVLYIAGGSSPVAIVPAGDIPWDKCVKEAAAHTRELSTSTDPYIVKCEQRGPNDMLWKLHPEWKQ